MRTAFNLLGPLTNPAGAARQLVGVPRPELTELVARSLGLLGSARAWVVHGADGLDEISTTGYTKVSEYRDGAVNTFYVHPADVGIAEGRSRGACEAAMRRRMRGSPATCSRAAAGAPRDIVLLNAGASLLIAGVVPDIAQGISRAASALDSGAAAGDARVSSSSCRTRHRRRRDGDDSDVARRSGGRSGSARDDRRGDPALG